MAKPSNIKPPKKNFDRFQYEKGNTKTGGRSSNYLATKKGPSGEKK